MTALQPLGDQAALASFEEEDAAACFADVVHRAAPDWLVDVVQAYATVAVFYSLDQTSYHQVADYLNRLAATAEGQSERPPGRLHIIPCCYDFPLDQARVAESRGLSVEQVISLHCQTEYRVYAIGFCPGFPYLGYLPAALAGVPRLQSPRVRVDAGSVGLTGRQTGVYTEPRPGGWHLIGRTPLELVSMADGYFPLRTGDRVRFERIDSAEYRRLEGQRLAEIDNNERGTMN
jgi:inhibitor of KinA